MFKTSFSKYLTAFIVIILVSFLILSGIITSMLRGYVNDNMKEKLELYGHVIVEHLVENKVEDIEIAARMGNTVWRISLSLFISLTLSVPPERSGSCSN